jgi:hypothetical protein
LSITGSYGSIEPLPTPVSQVSEGEGKDVLEFQLMILGFAPPGTWNDEKHHTPFE